jgi:hypothetical protein
MVPREKSRATPFVSPIVNCFAAFRQFKAGREVDEARIGFGSGIAHRNTDAVKHIPMRFLDHP